MKAKVFKQCEPIPCGTELIGRERVTVYAANLVHISTVDCVTKRDGWLKAEAITRYPVIEWL